MKFYVIKSYLVYWTGSTWHVDKTRAARYPLKSVVDAAAAVARAHPSMQPRVVGLSAKRKRARR